MCPHSALCSDFSILIIVSFFRVFFGQLTRHSYWKKFADCRLDNLTFLVNWAQLRARPYRTLHDSHIPMWRRGVSKTQTDSNNNKWRNDWFVSDMSKCQDYFLSNHIHKHLSNDEQVVARSDVWSLSLRKSIIKKEQLQLFIQKSRWHNRVARKILRRF